LIDAGISRAVIATKDPFAKVNGRGIAQLREAGIEVEVGLLEERAQILNESYFKFVTTGKPFVHAVIEYPAESAAPLLDWQPSKEFLESASKYDAVMIGSRPELNKVVIGQALNRERHRPLVIAANNSDAWLLEALQERIQGEISVVPFETRAPADVTGNVVRLEEGMAYDVARPQMDALRLALTRMEVTSLLCLPGLLDSSDMANFDEFDKVTLAVPSDTYTQGFAARWALGDIEFVLEDVSIELAGEFTEVTGYPTAQEVA
jgi:diaminohydroxyphosphoribosylaminopyrimidine deaminase/5-amino-6-(5-phosphoribosylamino)uracil reductase